MVLGFRLSRTIFRIYFKLEKDKLEIELDVSLKLILREQLINIMTEGLSSEIA